MREFSYALPEERIAKFPLERREDSKLLLYCGGEIGQSIFRRVADHLPSGALVVFNNTRVVRARLFFYKSTGARIEVFCLEPASPADYERAFAVHGACSWHCIVGNSKKWKAAEPLRMTYEGGILEAYQGEGDCVEFRWNSDHSFGELLELLGRTPIPPYLHRESEALDAVRYQTVYSRWDGSVAAPTAGLHFTPELLAELPEKGFQSVEVTLHVGAGTFLPVKEEDARNHSMHTEAFQVSLPVVKSLAQALIDGRPVVAIGTTSVRTLESLALLGARVVAEQSACPEHPVGQWEAYGPAADITGVASLQALAGWMHRERLQQLHSATQIMITPGYRWRVVNGLVTNFHQPKSTLLLLVSSFLGEQRWRSVYNYALSNGFRFLSYGDSSLLLR